VTGRRILSGMECAVDLARTLRRSWFRGHSRCFNMLDPGIFRRTIYPNYYYESGKNIEAFFIEEFMRHAPLLTEKVPGNDDYVSWLFLMQHHGLPTKLLDWTENALIALYFAVCDDTESDGELWALNPSSLNAHNSIDGIPSLDHPFVRYLAEEPLYKVSEKQNLMRKIGLNPTKDCYFQQIAIKPNMFFPRMAAQSGAFTMHPNPYTCMPIQELLIDERDLVRYIIPSRYKEDIFQDLVALGIKPVTLFQDLDSLCLTLKQECKNLPYAWKYPPSWGDGEHDNSKGI